MLMRWSMARTLATGTDSFPRATGQRATKAASSACTS